MKWKDGGDPAEKEEPNKEEYFDEEQYSPWARPTAGEGTGKLSKISVIFILLGLAIVTSVASLLMILLTPKGGGVTSEQLATLEGRIQKVEERLDKYEAIDEKVTRIWEEAKSFEKFKERFDRSEASMSLRMDHLTMSLEALQKQPGTVVKAPATPIASETKAETPQPAPKAAPKVQYHTVEAGDTFFNISKRYNLSVSELLKLNQLEEKSVLKVGQKLIVSKGQTE
ncbi:MAG: LysM domain-containing protein [Desulfobacteraceae bacterium]|nr:LysM domain-containing protein [Desulfobacteraceae bacterium]